SVLGGLGGGATHTFSVSFVDESNVPLADVFVDMVNAQGQAITEITSSSGTVAFQLAAGTYTIEAQKEGYDPLSQVIEIANSITSRFTLLEKIIPPKARVLLIKDASQNILSFSTNDISLSFSCQTGLAPAAQVVSFGNVQVLQPSNCVNLSVNVRVPGYIPSTQPLLGDTTEIILQREDSGGGNNPTTGSIEAYVVDETGAPIFAADVKVHKVPVSGSKILVTQKITDNGGFALVERLAPGTYILTAGKPGFKQVESGEIVVSAGDILESTLMLPAASTTKKLLVKVLSSANQLPVEGAQIGLFIQTVSGSYVEYGTYTSDTNGIVDQTLTDFNGSTSLV
ncbi:MAG: carboxypeptidase-like regulatory domain-containing protein, partial [archaeon]|nr:carboxypeptidase-like regulatory domain-containing protein [archaeon]